MAGRRPSRKGTPHPDIGVGPGQEIEWPGSSSLATDCVLNLISLAQRMLTFGLLVAKEHGVPSIGAFNVMTILHGERGPLLPSTIAERMIITRGTITEILATLERRGLVRRSVEAGDGRRRPVSLTTAGVETVERILPELHELERRWLEPLRPVDQEHLLRLVAMIQSGGPDRATT